jgi:hypothetical protein
MENLNQRIYFTVQIKCITRFIGAKSKVRVEWLKKKEKGHTKSYAPENGVIYFLIDPTCNLSS